MTPEAVRAQSLRARASQSDYIHARNLTLCVRVCPKQFAEREHDDFLLRVVISCRSYHSAAQVLPSPPIVRAELLRVL